MNKYNVVDSFASLFASGFVRIPAKHWNSFQVYLLNCDVMDCLTVKEIPGFVEVRVKED